MNYATDTRESLQLTNKEGEVVGEVFVKSAVGINEVWLVLHGKVSESWTLSEMSKADNPETNKDDTVLVLTS